MCIMGGGGGFCSSDVYKQRHKLFSYSENKDRERGFFVTIDVFIKVYIRCVNMQHFIGVYDKNYTLVL